MTEGLGVALITSSVSIVTATIMAATTIWQWKANKREREREQDLNVEGRLSTNEQQLKNHAALFQEIKDYIKDHEQVSKAVIKSNQLLMRDRIRYLAQQKIKAGCISYEDRKLLHDMWDVYHYELGGNGDLDLIMEAIDSLPLEVK